MERQQKRRYIIASVAVVVAIVVAASVLFGERYSSTKARDGILRQDLYTLRATIDQYTLHKSGRPQSLSDLITDGYLKQMPKDPITGRSDTWVIEWSADPKLPGIVNIHSGAQSKSTKGNQYSEW